MENKKFKGTKGNWQWDYYEDGNYASLYVLGKGDILNIQPIKDNTLYDINLASCSLEMLTLLQAINEVLQSGRVIEKNSIIHKEVNNLILKATEL